MNRIFHNHHGTFTLVQTCGACPEQYDLFNGQGSRVGYFRLRHGVFTVEVTDWYGVEVFRAYPKGDGCFETDERDYWLQQVPLAVFDYIYSDGFLGNKEFTWKE